MAAQQYAFAAGIGLEVATERAEVASYFAQEYAWHRAQAPFQGPRLRLTWHRPREAAAWVAHRHKVLAAWRFRWHGEAHGFHLEAWGNRWAIPMVHHMLVHHGLRWLTAQQGWVLLHAAGVARNGRGLVLTGPGGAGKTTTASLLLATGRWRILGDDYVFLHPSGRMAPYRTRAHLYRTLLAWVPQLRERLTLRERLALAVWGRVRAWSRERLKWPVRVPLERLWPQSPPPAEARLGAVVLLVPGPSAALEPLSVPQALEVLLPMQRYEARHFVRLLGRAGYPEDTFHPWWEQEARGLREVLEGVPVYRLQVPRGQPRDRTVQDVRALLEDLV